ncbi:hypothetical protein BFR40_12005 [Brochothrix thermosphacta]|nr:hypothetical protein BFR40_12005 [Brochothrix thermosphacta]
MSPVEDDYFYLKFINLQINQIALIKKRRINYRNEFLAVDTLLLFNVLSIFLKNELGVFTFAFSPEFQAYFIKIS